jgi:hypothetical protein
MPRRPEPEVTARDSRTLELTHGVCAAALLQPDLRQIAETLERTGRNLRDIPRLVAAITDVPSTHQSVKAIETEARAAGIGPGTVALERFLIVATALDALGRLTSVPESDDVKALFCEEFRFYASPPGEHATRYALGSASFVAMCKTASLRRFPGGQFDWEVGGIRRADLSAVSAGAILPTIAFAALKMRGLRPVFFSHLNWRRSNKSLLETEANRSYYRMARAMQLQPDIKGFGACSWFRSPATHRVSPHLAWLSRVFLENGGFVVEAGPDSGESGVFHRSQTRRRLYEAGEFRPTKGLVMWPRDAMIAWADAHPEFGSPDD